MPASRVINLGEKGKKKEQVSPFDPEEPPDEPQPRDESEFSPWGLVKRNIHGICCILFLICLVLVIVLTLELT